MDDIIEKIAGFNQTNEVFSLWYEITFLRLVLNQIVRSSPDLSKVVDNELLETCKKEAQAVVSARFPNFTLKFTAPQVEMTEESQECTPPTL